MLTKHYKSTLFYVQRLLFSRYQNASSLDACLARLNESLSSTDASYFWPKRLHASQIERARDDETAWQQMTGRPRQRWTTGLLKPTTCLSHQNKYPVHLARCLSEQIRHKSRIVNIRVTDESRQDSHASIATGSLKSSLAGCKETGVQVGALPGL